MQTLIHNSFFQKTLRMSNKLNVDVFNKNIDLQIKIILKS